MDINKVFQSKAFTAVIFSIAVILVLLVVFKTGIMVGLKKADFSCKWSDNYYKNFGGPKGGFMKMTNDRNFMAPHGVSGKIIKIEDPVIIIKGPDNSEKSVLTDENTSIARFKDAVKIGDLKIDEYIVVIGEPNNAGQIKAKFIRVMPGPSAGSLNPHDKLF